MWNDVMAACPAPAGVLDRQGAVVLANPALQALMAACPAGGGRAGQCLIGGGSGSCAGASCALRDWLAAGATGAFQGSCRQQASGRVIAWRAQVLPGRDQILLAGADEQSAAAPVAVPARAPGGNGGRDADYSREFLRALIEINTDLVLSANSDGMVTFANGGFLGDAEARRIMNAPLRGLVAPESLADFDARVRAIASGEAIHARLDAAGAGVLAGRRCLFSMGPLRGGAGTAGFIVIISDITELHEAWDKVRRSERLAATGQMAARVAHEINNPLAGIAGALQLIRADIDPASTAFRYVAMVDREIARISNIVRQMYGLYRQEQEPAQVIDLIPVLGEVAILMNTEAAQKDVEIEVVPGAPQWARVQEQNLRQVLFNIVRNAVEASPPGAVVSLSVDRCGRCMDVVVVDSGPGIGDGMVDRVFEPFFTSKSTSQGRGLGLGLSISDALVRGMGGKIEFENRPEGGCRCRVCLPEAGVESAGRA